MRRSDPPPRRSRPMLNAGIGIGIAVAVATAAHHHQHPQPGGAPARTSSIVQPDLPHGSAYTSASWARALLKAGGWPVTGCNVGAVEGWQRAEGSNPDWRNPLDTTQREPGSHAINHVGVQSYPSWQTGFAATLTTLRNGYYPRVLTALAAGDDAQAVANEVAASPWGTEPFQARCA
jgi:hypothetical protein